MMRNAVLALCALAAAGCKKEENVLRIGEVGSMTGAEATFGVSTHRGITLALKEINAGGGIHGKQLVLHSLDDQGKPEEAATAVKKLITRDKVEVVLGEVASSRSLAMAPIAQQSKVPMITPSSTNPRVTQVGDYIFRVCFIDPFQGTVMAKFGRETLKVAKVAILRDVRNDYSVGLADFFTAKFKELGGEIVADESYSAGDVDFRAQLTSLKGKAPEALFVPGYYTDVGLIARQARELGVTVPLMGGDGWDSEKLYEIGGTALEGSFFSNHYSVDDPAPKIQKFVEAYKAEYKAVPDGLAVMGYDAAQIMADALRRAGPDGKGAQIRDALAATKSFEGVSGVITIDANRNAEKAAVVLKVGTGGKYEYVTRISP